MTPAPDIYTAPAIAEQMITWMDQQDAEPDQQPAELMSMSDLLTDPQQVDRINAAIAYLEAMADMTAKEIARQQARQRAIESASYALQRAVLTTLEEQQQTVAHGQYCTLKLRRNPPAVKIERPELIPDMYMRQPPPPPPVADKTAIRAALDSGVYVPGAVITRGSRLERK